MPKVKKKETINKPTPKIRKNLVIFRGSSPREGETFGAHGIHFEKNVVYEVSDEVFEYLKAHKYFTLFKEISTEVIDFPKVKS